MEEKNKLKLPSDEEIDKQFPIEENPNINKRGNVVYSIERARMKARREGAKWMKDKVEIIKGKAYALGVVSGLMIAYIIYVLYSI